MHPSVCCYYESCVLSLNLGHCEFISDWTLGEKDGFMILSDRRSPAPWRRRVWAWWGCLLMVTIVLVWVHRRQSFRFTPTVSSPIRDQIVAHSIRVARMTNLTSTSFEEMAMQASERSRNQSAVCLNHFIGHYWSEAAYSLADCHSDLVWIVEDPLGKCVNEWRRSSLPVSPSPKPNLEMMIDSQQEHKASPWCQGKRPSYEIRRHLCVPQYDRMTPAQPEGELIGWLDLNMAYELAYEEKTTQSFSSVGLLLCQLDQIFDAMRIYAETDIRLYDDQGNFLPKDTARHRAQVENTIFHLPVNKDTFVRLEENRKRFTRRGRAKAAAEYAAYMAATASGSSEYVAHAQKEAKKAADALAAIR